MVSLIFLPEYQLLVVGRCNINIVSHVVRLMDGAANDSQDIEEDRVLCKASSDIQRAWRGCISRKRTRWLRMEREGRRRLSRMRKEAEDERERTRLLKEEEEAKAKLVLEEERSESRTEVPLRGTTNRWIECSRNVKVSSEMARPTN